MYWTQNEVTCFLNRQQAGSRLIVRGIRDYIVLWKVHYFSTISFIKDLCRQVLIIKIYGCSINFIQPFFDYNGTSKNNFFSPLVSTQFLWVFHFNAWITYVRFSPLSVHILNCRQQQLMWCYFYGHHAKKEEIATISSHRFCNFFNKTQLRTSR